MTFLPIVGRELRVAARRLGTYWVRVAMAGGATVVGACILLFSLNVAPQKIGYYIFVGLAGLSLLFSLLYGRHATADCLSSEKRDGTLGLLFLTDLKGHDVVLGKLAATSMGGFYGLLALFPVLAIPLLMGGITSGEFWRIVLVLVNTFLFSLSVGILVSSFSWEARRAVGSNFLLLLLLSGIPPAIAFTLAASLGAPPISELFLSCPVYTFYTSLAGPYALKAHDYWTSLAFIHALTWLMLILASRIAPGAWQDRPVQPAQKSWRSRWRRLSFGGPAGQRAFRAEALNINAFYWLAARARFKPVHVWIFIACIGVWWLIGWATAGKIWFDIVTYVITALLLNITFKIWLMIEASQRLAEDHQAGALELLLSTPLSVQDILHGQWLALRRQFGRPLIAVLIIQLGLLLLARTSSDSPELVPVFIASSFMLILDMAAAGWVAMWLALKVKKPHQAALGAVIRILVLPWLLLGAVAGLVGIWYQFAAPAPWSPSWKFHLGLWIAFGLSADLLFGLLARTRLRNYFRQLALLHLTSTPAVGTTSRLKNRAIPPAPNIPRTRRGRQHLLPLHKPFHAKKVWVPVSLCLILLGLWLSGVFPSSKRFPPPKVVTMAQSNGSLQVFPGSSGLLAILPDSSLWSWGAGLPGSTNNNRWERLGTERNWSKVAASYNRIIGLGSDGTLWEWKKQPTGFGVPRQIDDGENWIDVASLVSGNYMAAIRRDGTLWEWGNSSPMRWRKRGSSDPTQVGTDVHWRSLSGNNSAMMALQSDGSLWVWGEIYSFANAMAARTLVSEPKRLCQETNWTGFFQSYPVLARTSSAEAWELSGLAPNPEAPAGAVCSLVATNARINSFALAYSGERTLYEIRPNGTLWERACPFTGRNPAKASQWRQVGGRTDWVSLYPAGPTAAGLTRDGTLWMWGYDPTQTAHREVIGSLRIIRARISAVFGGVPMNFAPGPIPLFQREPRPIMQLRTTQPRD